MFNNTIWITKQYWHCFWYIVHRVHQEWLYSKWNNDDASKIGKEYVHYKSFILLHTINRSLSLYSYFKKTTLTPVWCNNSVIGNVLIQKKCSKDVSYGNNGHPCCVRFFIEIHIQLYFYIVFTDIKQQLRSSHQWRLHNGPAKPNNKTYILISSNPICYIAPLKQKKCCTSIRSI